MCGTCLTDPFARMQVNATASHAVTTQDDLTHLSTAERSRLVEAVQAASELVARAARGVETAKLPYGECECRYRS